MDDTRSTIMIADDEMLNRHILYNSLKEDYNVIIAETGEKALDKISEEKVDLILLDIIMPGINGFDVLVRLKECKETVDIPVIFITGLTSAADETKGLMLGAVDYITKPFNIDIVRARVRTHLKIVKQMRLIESIGLIDSLTDLANRRRFDQQLKIEWARAMREKKPLSLLMIDVDRFKSYNDSYGHPMGDALLQSLARVFKGCVRRPTDLVARVGGEEFGVLLPGSDLTGALIVAETFRQTVEGLAVPAGYDPEKFVTISIGVGSAFPGADIEMPIEEFVKSCDEKLYTAKRTGRNKVCG